MQIVDLRDKSDAYIRNARSIEKILNSFGRSEQIRQERQRTMRVLQAMAADGDVAAAAMEPATFGTGIEGFIQRLGAAYAPQAAGVREQIAARGIQQAFPSPAEEARLEYYKSRQGTATNAKTMTRFRNLKTFRDDLKKRLEEETEPEIRDILKEQILQIEPKMEEINKQISGVPTSAEIVAGKSLSDTLSFQPSGFISPGQVPAQPTDTGIPVEFGEYIDKLDDESRSELQQILESGNQELMQRALLLLRDKYGTVR